MKIKNISTQPITVHLHNKIGYDITISLLPGQFVYGDSDVKTKNLIIYQTKKLVSLIEERKPDNLQYNQVYDNETSSVEPPKLEVEESEPVIVPTTSIDVEITLKGNTNKIEIIDGSKFLYQKDQKVLKKKKVKSKKKVGRPKKRGRKKGFKFPKDTNNQNSDNQ